MWSWATSWAINPWSLSSEQDLSDSSAPEDAGSTLCSKLCVNPVQTQIYSLRICSHRAHVDLHHQASPESVTVEELEILLICELSSPGLCKVL